MSDQGFPPYGNPQSPQPWQAPAPQPPQFGTPPGGHVPPQQGFQPQPGPPLPPPGFINLTIQGNVLTSSMITPSVVLDGHPIPAQYGLNLIPVIPGRHHVHVYGEWMRRYGQADIQLDVPVGQHVPVFYRAPFHQFTTGNIGHVPQPMKGLGVLIGVMVFLFALFTLPFVAVALS